MTIKKVLKNVLKNVLTKVLNTLKEWGKGAAYAVNHGNNR